MRQPQLAYEMLIQVFCVNLPQLISLPRMEEKNTLVRGLGLKEATALNMIDMVGIGPFIIIPFVILAMNGPACILAWILGAVLSYLDGTVWAELGAAYPEAGGSYVFLQKLYGEKKWGSYFSFLYIWQTTIQAPLVIASGAIGFAQYLHFLIPVNPIQQKLAGAALIVFIAILLYRKITDIGKISVFMWIIVAGTMCWLIFAGLSHFNKGYAFDIPKGSLDMTPAFFVGLGMASIKTIYSFLGYYNVCHLGSEIKNPEKNIPRSIFLSITGITVLYLLMQISILGAIPWREAAASPFLISTFFERIYGHAAAVTATVLILFIAMTSLFSATLGYSRVPYAAAQNGDYFKIFARVHPTKQFPHMSLLILCGVAFVFSLLFKLTEVITAIIVMRILVQFIGQAFGLMLLRMRKKELHFPYKMWLFPMPAIASMLLWAFVFVSSGWEYILFALSAIAAGSILFFARAHYLNRFPFVKETVPEN
jgi:fructoselysine transporter